MTSIKWYDRPWTSMPPSAWAAMILKPDAIGRPTEKAAFLHLMYQAEKLEKLREALELVRIHTYTYALGSTTRGN